MTSPLVALRDTGDSRGGYPVLAPDQEAGPIIRALGAGFSGRLLRLYRLVRTFLQRGAQTEPEPAYLLLSDNDGGFARTGFFLGDEDKTQTDYVDLVRDQIVAGQFGSIDQIYPHELGHVLLRILAGERPPGGANQVHAISLRTDPLLAFDEGFAEHLQVMAIDDPQADPATQALGMSRSARRSMDEQLSGYRAQLVNCDVAESPLARRFLAWFGQTEQTERYFGVKGNLFAREPAVPDQLLVSTDPYRAYLIESVVPGTSADQARTPNRAVAVEGFVATFFHRLVTADFCRDRREKPSFYAMFGAAPDHLLPLENAYLKAFYAIHVGQAQTLDGFVQSYCNCYREEAAGVDGLLRDLLCGQEFRPAPAIWLASPTFRTGTSVFDQFRSVPRVHTFDLNAASLVDLVTIPGVDVSMARRIIAALPVNDLFELRTLPGMTGGTCEALEQMAAAMEWNRPSDIEAGFIRGISRIVSSYPSA